MLIPILLSELKLDTPNTEALLSTSDSQDKVGGTPRWEQDAQGQLDYAWVQYHCTQYYLTCYDIKNLHFFMFPISQLYY